MTKNEMDYFDSSMFGPAMLFLNQYFNFFIPEYYVLWSCVVSKLFPSMYTVCKKIIVVIIILNYKAVKYPFSLIVRHVSLKIYF